jgi:hypothetical protein
MHKTDADVDVLADDEYCSWTISRILKTKHEAAVGPKFELFILGNVV